jgi:copper(I)-binding protein
MAEKIDPIAVRGKYPAMVLKMRFHPIFFPALFLSAIFFSTSAMAGDALQNTGDEPLRLTGGSAAMAGMAMPMGTTRKVVQGTEVLGMKGVDFIEIPAHGERVLKPGGDHLMLMNLKSHPRPGEKVTVTLEFEPGHRKVTIDMPAKLDAAQ